MHHHVCNGGHGSSLAAATLRQLGIRRATDLVGFGLLLIGTPAVTSTRNDPLFGVRPEVSVGVQPHVSLPAAAG
jgi:hypothetical protein